MTHAQANILVASRAKALKKVRTFFDERGYFEVDPPLLSAYANVDAFVDPITTTDGSYLFTSPEYPMKKILAETASNIYYVGHVFRKEIPSPLHLQEFSMIEWYKIHTDETAFLDEIFSLVRLFLPITTMEMLSYEEAFLRYAKKPDEDISRFSKIEQQQYIMGTFIEPQLGKNGLTIIHSFPPEQALLAKVRMKNGKAVAQRYELFYQGIELGNGFEELSDAKEQEMRFIRENQIRTSHGRDPLPIDHELLRALDRGLPENTFGMAVGFDRLFMMENKIDHINHAAFPSSIR